MRNTSSRSAGPRRHREKGAGQGENVRGGDLYDTVTRRIVAELEAGRLPWVQPWGRPGPGGQGDRSEGTGGKGTGPKRTVLAPALPRNALTARPYSGINILILWGAVIENGWPSQGWLTFRQALQAGGHVRKGEHGTCVVYADRFTPEAERNRAQETGEDARTIPFLKRFTVFNVAQCEGLGDGGEGRTGAGLAPDPVPLPEREIVPLAEEVIAASGVDFRIGGDKAYYVPSADFVQVPPQPAFRDQVNYYRTCLHELTHATGHPRRLDRHLANVFGSKDYAREELIAEMGSAFLCASLGIVPTVRHADYIGAWLDVLREDNRAIFRAASAASKAAEWLLARHRSMRDGEGESTASGGQVANSESGTGEGRVAA
ncbi:ArdC family protein [Novosphingobium malaysiense]|uniref:ArdC family protein n=1 Tax=Novosphingobium malaysiense TaxID=1348853 RepID=UPI000690E8E5|nr:zincin-like metallopeptidase domain-containing protein [Novosphingobium malaysiense]